MRHFTDITINVLKRDRGVKLDDFFEEDVKQDGAQPDCTHEADAAHALFCFLFLTFC